MSVGRILPNQECEEEPMKHGKNDFYTFPPLERPGRRDLKFLLQWKFLTAAAVVLGLIIWIIVASILTTDDDRVQGATTDPHARTVNFNGTRIVQGMTKAEVTKILGSPDFVARKGSIFGSREEWVYSSNGQSSNLVFEEGKLTEYTAHK